MRLSRKQCMVDMQRGNMFAVPRQLSEVGIDLSAFPSEKHFASWIGICSGNKESAGKRLSGQTTKGNVYLRAALAEVSWCLSRMKGNYLSAHYHHFTRRMVKPKAIVASSHSMAVIAYHVLKKRKPYQDLGPTYAHGRTDDETSPPALGGSRL